MPSIGILIQKSLFAKCLQYPSPKTSAFSVLILSVGAICNLRCAKQETANRGGGGGRVVCSGLRTLSIVHAHSSAAALGFWWSERAIHARPREEPSSYRLAQGMLFPWLQVQTSESPLGMDVGSACFCEVCSDCRAERGLEALL